jgi:hypothetical protein
MTYDKKSPPIISSSLLAKVKKARARNQIIFKEEYIKWLKLITRNDWGRRCTEYAKGCPCCDAWKMYDKIK